MLMLNIYFCASPDGVVWVLISMFYLYQVQGMSFIAAVLLLNMDVPTAFICFANLLNRPCQIAFFRLDEILVSC